MNIIIAYKSGTSDEFSENQLDCSVLSIRDHASQIIDAWVSRVSIYKFDAYNAVLLDEVIAIRVRE